MDITLEELLALASNPEIKALPAALAFASAGTVPWQETIDKTMRLATDMDIWFIAQHAAVIFRTYAPIVDEVSTRWQKSGDCGELYVDATLRINGEVFDPNGCDLSEEIAEPINEIDGQKALLSLYSAVEDRMWPCQMLENINRANGALPTLCRVEDALAAASRVDASIRSHLEQRVLDARTAPGSRPPAPARF